jgi:hypothetical protein
MLERKLAAYRRRFPVHCTASASAICRTQLLENRDSDDDEWPQKHKS